MAKNPAMLKPIKAGALLPKIGVTGARRPAAPMAAPMMQNTASPLSASLKKGGKVKAKSKRSK